MRWCRGARTLVEMACVISYGWSTGRKKILSNDWVNKSDELLLYSSSTVGSPWFDFQGASQPRLYVLLKGRVTQTRIHKKREAWNIITTSYSMDREVPTCSRGGFMGCNQR